METFADYLETIDDTDHRATLRDVIEQIQVDNSGLKLEIKWNQPMLTDHGTFIMGFSVAKKHFSIAPERLVLDEFRSQIDSAGYDLSKALMKVQWDQKVNFELLNAIVMHTRELKKNTSTFWLR